MSSDPSRMSASFSTPHIPPRVVSGDKEEHKKKEKEEVEAKPQKGFSRITVDTDTPAAKGVQPIRRTHSALSLTFEQEAQAAPIVRRARSVGTQARRSPTENLERKLAQNSSALAATKETLQRTHAGNVAHLDQKIQELTKEREQLTALLKEVQPLLDARSRILTSVAYQTAVPKTVAKEIVKLKELNPKKLSQDARAIAQDTVKLASSALSKAKDDTESRMESLGKISKSALKACKAELKSIKSSQEALTKLLLKFNGSLARVTVTHIIRSTPTTMRALSSRAALRSLSLESAYFTTTQKELSRSGSIARHMSRIESVGAQALCLQSAMQARLTALKESTTQAASGFQSIEGELQAFEEAIATLESQQEELESKLLDAKPGQPGLDIVHRYKDSINELKAIHAELKSCPAAKYEELQNLRREVLSQANESPAKVYSAFQKLANWAESRATTQFLQERADAVRKEFSAASFGALALSSDEEKEVTAVLEGKKEITQVDKKTLTSILNKEMIKELFVKSSSPNARLERLLALMYEADLQIDAEPFSEILTTYIGKSDFAQEKDFYVQAHNEVSKPLNELRKQIGEIGKPKGLFFSSTSDPRARFHDAQNSIKKLQGTLEALKNEAEGNPTQMMCVQALENDISNLQESMNDVARNLLTGTTREQEGILKNFGKADGSGKNAEWVQKNQKAIVALLGDEIVRALYSPDPTAAASASHHVKMILDDMPQEARASVLQDVAKRAPDLVSTYVSSIIQEKVLPTVSQARELHAAIFDGLQQPDIDAEKINQQIATVVSTLKERGPAWAKDYVTVATCGLQEAQEVVNSLLEPEVQAPPPVDPRAALEEMSAEFDTLLDAYLKTDDQVNESVLASIARTFTRPGSGKWDDSRAVNFGKAQALLQKMKNLEQVEFADTIRAKSDRLQHIQSNNFLQLSSNQQELSAQLLAGRLPQMEIEAQARQIGQVLGIEMAKALYLPAGASKNQAIEHAGKVVKLIGENKELLEKIKNQTELLASQFLAQNSALEKALKLFGSPENRAQSAVTALRLIADGIKKNGPDTPFLCNEAQKQLKALKTLVEESKESDHASFLQGRLLEAEGNLVSACSLTDDEKKVIEKMAQGALAMTKASRHQAAVNIASKQMTTVLASSDSAVQQEADEVLNNALTKLGIKLQDYFNNPTMDPASSDLYTQTFSEFQKSYTKAHAESLKTLFSDYISHNTLIGPKVRELAANMQALDNVSQSWTQFSELSSKTNELMRDISSTISTMWLGQFTNMITGKYSNDFTFVIPDKIQKAVFSRIGAIKEVKEAKDEIVKLQMQLIAEDTPLEKLDDIKAEINKASNSLIKLVKDNNYEGAKDKVTAKLLGLPSEADVSKIVATRKLKPFEPLLKNMALLMKDSTFSKEKYASWSDELNKLAQLHPDLLFEALNSILRSDLPADESSKKRELETKRPEMLRSLFSLMDDASRERCEKMLINASLPPRVPPQMGELLGEFTSFGFEFAKLGTTLASLERFLAHTPIDPNIRGEIRTLIIDLEKMLNSLEGIEPTEQENLKALLKEMQDPAKARDVMLLNSQSFKARLAKAFNSAKDPQALVKSLLAERVALINQNLAKINSYMPQIIAAAKKSGLEDLKELAKATRIRDVGATETVDDIVSSLFEKAGFQAFFTQIASRENDTCRVVLRNIEDPATRMKLVDVITSAASSLNEMNRMNV